MLSFDHVLHMTSDVNGIASAAMAAEARGGPQSAKNLTPTPLVFSTRRRPCALATRSLCRVMPRAAGDAWNVVSRIWNLPPAVDDGLRPCRSARRPRQDGAGLAIPGAAWHWGR